MSMLWTFDIICRLWMNCDNFSLSLIVSKKKLIFCGCLMYFSQYNQLIWITLCIHNSSKHLKIKISFEHILIFSTISVGKIIPNYNVQLKIYDIE